MAFGTDRLLEVKSQYEAEEIEKRETEERDRQRRRNKALAKTLVEATREKVPVPDGETRHGLLAPVINGKDSKDSREFIDKLGLGADFPVDALRLGATGTYTSHAYDYTLTLRNGPSYRWCGAFIAGETDNALNLATRVAATGTNLACKEKVDGPWLPVELEDEKYEFIKTVGGLFLPEITRELEQK